MAAEAVLGVTVQATVDKAVALIAEEFGLVRNFRSDLRKLKASLEMLRAFLYDAETRQISSKAVRLWVERLKEVAFDADILLDEINYEALKRKVQIQKRIEEKVCFPFGLSEPLTFRYKMAHKIRDINDKLKAVNAEASMYGLQSHVAPPTQAVHALPKRNETDAYSIEPTVIGREKDVDNIVKMVLNSKDKTVAVIPIVGMGGLGKTTVAQSVYSDQRIGGYFDQKIWICVSEDFESKRIFKLMLEQLGRKYQLESRQAILKELQDEIKGKRCLLVLDDVWYEEGAPSDHISWNEMWEDFKKSFGGINLAKGSCILVTTRDQRVSSKVVTQTSSVVLLGKLSLDECWEIIKVRAFGNKDAPDVFDELGKKISIKCQGLPLAARVLGGVLCGNGINVWHSFLESGLSDLEGNESGITKILKLSYDRLKYPSLKKCFALCSIFPKDTRMYVVDLVQIWMANGLLQPNRGDGREMEDIGFTFFSILLKTSLLEEAERDQFNNITKVTMHDLVHDLAESILSFEEYSKKRYLLMESLEDASQNMNVRGQRSILPTLCFKNVASDDIFSNFRFLNILKLSGDEVKVLPTSIGKLIHLRYLDTSKTLIRKLPNSICKLYNLQTLSLSLSLDTYYYFPHDFKDLVNLRHLNFRLIKSMPADIGKLTSLQTLPLFIVGTDKGYKIEELGSLKCLRGSLEITNLEMVGGKEEARCADLFSKHNLETLGLRWSYREVIANNNDEDVLEGLQPPPKLMILNITGFMGVHFPSWLKSSIGGLGLQNLVVMRLFNCSECKELPAVGQLPNLQSLKLRALDNVKRIGPEFYGISSSARGRGQVTTKFFPSLVKLSIRSMSRLEEWMDNIVALDGKVGHEVPILFPQLKEMKIIECLNLRSTPSCFPCLEELKMWMVKSRTPLARICNSNLTTLKKVHIIDVEELTSLSEGLLHNNLECLDLWGCAHLKRLSVPHGAYRLYDLTIIDCNELEEITAGVPKCLPSLRHLEIRRCKGLVSLPSGLLECASSLQQLILRDCNNLMSFQIDLQQLPSLQHLILRDCNNLMSFQIDLQQLPSLSELEITGCGQLTILPRGGFGHLTILESLKLGPFSDTISIDSFQDSLDGLPQLSSSLTFLDLYGRPHWKDLPHQIQHLTALRELRINGFGVEALPNWLGNLSSLYYLELEDCNELSLLPPTEDMRRLTQLRHFRMYNCPILEERCTPESQSHTDSQWPKICHLIL